MTLQFNFIYQTFHKNSCPIPQCLITWQKQGVLVAINIKFAVSASLSAAHLVPTLTVGLKIQRRVIFAPALVA